MKRTNVVMDEALVRKAKSATGIKTTRSLVDHALREIVRHARQRDLLKLKGKVDWQGNLAKMRRGRFAR